MKTLTIPRNDNDIALAPRPARSPSELRARIEDALNNPAAAIERIWAQHGLTHVAHDILDGRNPLDALRSLRAVMFADGEGAAPAGMFTRVDLIETVPGTRNTTLDGQDVNDIWNQMQQMLAAFNAAIMPRIAALTFQVNRPSEEVGVPYSPGFQEATELGRPSKIAIKRIRRSFPLRHYDIATGFTQEYIDSATGAQLTALFPTIRADWINLQLSLVYDALFGNANYTDKDDLLIRRLYNGDGEVPPSIARWTFDGTHNHYHVADTPGTPDRDDLDSMSDNLVHHGFREFGGQDVAFVLHVHRDDLQDIREMDGWIPAASAERAEILSESGVVVGRRRTAATPSGMNVEGFIGDWTVVQDNYIPLGYYLGVVENNAFSTRNVVGLRQHDNPSVRGLRLIEGNRQNYPLYDSVYDGYVGAGVGQRGSAVVLDTANSGYVPPELFVAH